MLTIQTLHGVLIAVAATVGITVAVSIAYAAAGALFRRDQARTARALRAATIAARQPAQTDQTRELVLR